MGSHLLSLSGKVCSRNHQMEKAIQLIQKHFPNVHGVYLFGSYQTEYERTDSDVDLAVLLPVKEADLAGHLPLSDLSKDLSNCFNRTIDLINLRQVDTVFQNEIIVNGRLILKADSFEVEQFEMLTLSKYLKLNEERSQIIAEICESGSVYS